jgi:hypothetical protein
MLGQRSCLILANIAVLSSFIADVAAVPAPEITPPPVLSARAAEFTGVSIPEVSIPPVSIPSITVNSYTRSEFSLSLNLPTPTCTRTITPDKNGYLPPGTCEALYNFYPSFAAAAVMATVFGILTAAHLIQASIFKTGFCWVIFMGALWEFGGYLVHSFATRHQQSAGLALVAQLLILLGPLCMLIN